MSSTKTLPPLSANINVTAMSASPLSGDGIWLQGLNFGLRVAY